MKKILLVYMLLIAMVSSLAACVAKDNPPSNDGENSNKTPVHTHAFGEWNLIVKPTCTEDGTKVRYCSCGVRQKETIVSLGHTEVVDTAVDATCTKTG